MLNQKNLILKKASFDSIQQRGTKTCLGIYELEILRHHQIKQQSEGPRDVPGNHLSVQQKPIPSFIPAWMGLNHWAVPLTCRVRFHGRHTCCRSTNLLFICVFQSKKTPLSSSSCRWRVRRGTLKRLHTRRGNCGSKRLRARSLPACSLVRA